ncbi:MAG: DEAD/DEAH box helicase family protein [Candidatus Nanopelagicaceae bacterium]
MTLRPYQESVRREISGFFKKGVNGVLLYAPTGSGKTHIACQIIVDAISESRRVLFLVHRTKLIDQTVATLEKNYGVREKIGIIAPDHPPDYTRPIQIAMVQTIANREFPPDIGLIIIDEAHTVSHFTVIPKLIDNYTEKVYCERRKSYVNGPWVLSKCRILGLSASPWRTKRSEGFCLFFQEKVEAPFPRELMSMGHLCEAKVFTWKGLIDRSKLKVGKEGDYTQESLKLVCDERFNESVVKTFKEDFSDRKAIAFCANVDQARDLAQQFNNSGIVSEVIVGDTSETERQDIYHKFRVGEIQVVCSVAVLCEGFDEPSCDCAIIARPTKSRALFVQMCGRSLRLSDGKENAALLDFGGNVVRLGSPTRRYPINLCPRLPTKKCPECGYEFVSLGARLCPQCGHEFVPPQKGTNGSNNGFDRTALGEFCEVPLTVAEREQFSWLRKELLAHFKSGQSIGKVTMLFYDRYNSLPLQSWYLNAIFSHKEDVLARKSDEQKLLRFLRETNPNAPTKWYLTQMRNEFGNGFGNRSHDLYLWNWQEVFGSTHYEDVIDSYNAQKDTATPDFDLVLDYCLSQYFKDRPQELSSELE